MIILLMGLSFSPTIEPLGYQTFKKPNAYILAHIESSPINHQTLSNPLILYPQDSLQYQHQYLLLKDEGWREDNDIVCQLAS